jgi:phenylacetate-CoA ligase
VSALARLFEAAPRYAALLRSQYWRPERLESYREQQLKKTLSAALKIPFYRERLGSAPRPEDLPRLPLLKRADVEPLRQSVISMHPAGRPFVSERSSGTSGPAVKFLFDSPHQAGRNAARVRYLRMHGWNPLQRSAWFAGGRLLVTPDPDYQAIGELIRWFASFGVKFFPTATPFGEQVDILDQMKAVSVYGFPSGIDGIVRVLEQTGRRLPSLRRALCGGEAVDDSLRERARRTFGFDLRDNYGSTETFVAFECPAGSYHINAEHVWVEIVDQAGNPVAPGQMGRVLLTTLENYLMPLVRYEIGDYAVAARGECACGRTLPLLGRVLGRQTNMLRLPDSTMTSGWPAVGTLREFSELKFFQLVQKSIMQFSVRYVSDRTLTPETEAEIRSRLREDGLWEHAEVSFEQVDEIARAPSGKFMVTLCEVPP